MSIIQYICAYIVTIIMYTNTHVFEKKLCMSAYTVLFGCKLCSFSLCLFIYFITKFDCSKIRFGIKIYTANKTCFYYCITVMKLSCVWVSFI